MHFREQLVHEKWLPDLIERAIPMSQVGEVHTRTLHVQMNTTIVVVTL
jgi:hypothetical protein